MRIPEAEPVRARPDTDEREAAVFRTPEADERTAVVFRTAPEVMGREAADFRAVAEAVERVAAGREADVVERAVVVFRIEPEADALRIVPEAVDRPVAGRFCDEADADERAAVARPAAGRFRSEPDAAESPAVEALRVEPDAFRTEVAADMPVRAAALRTDAVRDEVAEAPCPAADRDAEVRAAEAFRAAPVRAAPAVLRAEAAFAVRLTAALFPAVVETAFSAIAERVRPALAAAPLSRADIPRAEAAEVRVVVRDRDPFARPPGFFRPCSSRTCDRSRSTSPLRARSNTPSTWSAPDRTILPIPLDERRFLVDRDESVSSMSMTASRALLVAVSVSDVAICTMPRSVWNTMRTPLSSDTPPRARFRVVLRLNATVRW
ncbi:hypothetical protein [Herbidospora sp. RD11066]